MNSEPVQQAHWQTVNQMFSSYRMAQVLITATSLGVFRHLAAGPQPTAALAAQIGANPQALARLLNAAVALDLLEKDGDKYANGPLAQSCLAREGPYYLGNMVGREGAFYDRWSHLPEAVRSGTRPEPNVRDESEQNWVWDFEMALYDLSRAIAPAVAEALSLPAGRPLSVLDVGGGHGGYSMALVRRYPNVRVTVFELPAAAEVARELIAREGLSGRIAVEEGDFQQQRLGDGYDLLLLFGVLVSETPAGKVALLRKAHDALVPGGSVAIRGFWLNDERTGPLRETLFSLHMLLSTEAGDISTLRQMHGWLDEAGFTRPEQIPLPAWLDSNLLLAQRPA